MPITSKTIYKMLLKTFNKTPLKTLNKTPSKTMPMRMEFLRLKIRPHSTDCLPHRTMSMLLSMPMWTLSMSTQPRQPALLEPVLVSPDP